ncbi:UDP-4-amino-4,6-dideoxy-N-acetyl-beta-L-altrosamine N-acetyltransferase [Campylobacter sp. 2014D-0216]|uniref:UDP-4-amino-4, 6-dideoxy-N-acetyl-beta-L-altrosamine N-acetyltransferase n=1 Tax=Campylobacter sp. 2014D-0216 TaxID=1813595 RepID=UPI0018A4556E|nr:UDP-4-amino-4,6-dideoxy-N-acetyl-beta-L-altrosamine N-acetyltransferase [Campylobacter sp. 2014D-0216]QOR00962.1 UDP-4-amino-4,6-dideoxy-N-acetyl-beta-L-altrosamine N-acetyltransferase [Campylobacter sp. 2014D-0216]
MITYKNFTELDEEEAKEIFHIRNSSHVSKFMKTQHISLEEHQLFLQKLKEINKQQYFLLLKDDTKIGVIYFINITNHSCEFGLYGIQKGVGELLMQEVKNYAFNILKVQTLNACVFKENTKALNLYLRHSFEITKEDCDFYFVVLNNPHRNFMF